MGDTQFDSFQCLNFGKKWFIQYCFAQNSILNIIHSNALETWLMGLQLGKDARLKVVDVVAHAHVKIDVKELFSDFHILATYFFVCHK